MMFLKYIFPCKLFSDALILIFAGYNADILCLQEVDRNLFDYDLQYILPSLSPLNGLYAGKKSDSTKEGSATFWNNNKFR